MVELKKIAAPIVQNRNRFMDGCFNKMIYEEALGVALNKIEANLKIFKTKFPHVSINHIYIPEENKLWTASFFPGLVYLAYEATGSAHYLEFTDDYLGSFRWRLEKGHTATHDLGFLYTLSCVANYKITGYEPAKQLALRAAEKLMSRYHEAGGYLQAWGEMGLKYPEVKIIIDTMLNLPLLYWASEVSGEPRYYQAALAHAVTAAQYLVREDASTYHTYLMDPDTGKAVTGKTHQGRFDESTWARGQAWAVYGFALSYVYTHHPYFLEIAQKTAKFFINHLPADFVPYWDFSFNDQEPDIRDSSAAAIFCCGLLEIVKYLEDEMEREFMKKVVYKVMESLICNYSTALDSDSNGLLLHGMYHRNNGADECTIWGDYFYMEALMRLLTDLRLYW